MSADAFVRAPILTVVHGSSTALLNVTGGRIDLCLVGGDPKNLHAFFTEDLETFGPVRDTPPADRISVPYAGDNGGGSGRSAPSLHGVPAGLRGRRFGSLAYREYMWGGGWGAYALGQVGSRVSGVAITFTNRKTTDATVRNGWYFAWWPWISTPKTVTVTTTSGTITSPLIRSNGGRRAINPGCQPGSSSCVFAKTSPARR
jgi:hypothetical protein